MKDPEFKKMIGQRKSNDDGFTYIYGCCKGGYSRHSRATKANKIYVRNDKRAVKAKALRRILKEEAE